MKTVYHIHMRLPWHHPVNKTDFVMDRFLNRMRGITTISNRPVVIPIVPPIPGIFTKNI